jgi:2-dehydro-3-deoxy-D-arabinonate dehydratase
MAETPGQGGMRVGQCRVDGRLRVVVAPDSAQRARLLVDRGEPGLAAWIRRARERGEPLGALLADEAGQEVAGDFEAGVVRHGGDALPLRVPVDAPEVWGAGVTYLRSRDAREAESSPHHSADVYSRVYEAERPELFLKDSGCRRTVGTGDHVAVRGDSRWTVPEPEIALVLDAEGTIVGYTIGNDVSARDIEGQNPLYLTQSKTYASSCALGPAIWLPPAGTADHELEVTLRIVDAAGDVAFEGGTSTAAMVRTFAELVSFLLAHNRVADGTVLLTGTGIVPPDDLSLREGDRVEIAVPEIGVLANHVRQLSADGQPARPTSS